MHTSINTMKKNSLILQALRDIFCRHITSLFPNTFITITRLDLYAKKGIVKVYISCLKNGDPTSIIEQLTAKQPMIRGLLGKRLASKLRIIPMLEFYVDNALDEAFHVINLLQKIAAPSNHNRLPNAER